MIPQEHRIIAALGHLGLVVPDFRPPRWWQFAARRKERDIQEALVAAGLPALDDYGRLVFSGFDSFVERQQDRMSRAQCWAMDWCRSLGLPYRVPWEPGLVVCVRTHDVSAMTAHDRIQLAREELVLSKSEGAV